MNKKKVLALLLATSVIVGNTGLEGYATETSDCAKEEVIYVMTDAAGSVKTIDAVNIFGKGDVTDYGDYTDVRMLNSTDEITQEGDKITFTSDQDKIYYQGTMQNAQIPWNIMITYKLDGREVTPQELAGGSGALSIHVEITQNDQCDDTFYDNYALQVAFTLDTNQCENIVADNATLANVGADKQISYTVLPGKGLDATITADVTDFTMDAATINGIKLNLDVDIDDEELVDQVDEIMDAAKKLNDGASDLSGGTADLLDGADRLNDGAKSLYDGADSLDDGIGSLNQGVTSMQKALNKLNKQSKNLTGGSAKMLKALKTLQSQLTPVTLSTESLTQLTESSASIKKGIADAYKGTVALNKSLSYDSYKTTMKNNGLDIDQLQNGNTQAIQSLSAQIKELSASITQLKSISGYESNQEYQAQVAQLQAQVDSLTNVVTLLQGNNAAISGTSQYLDAAGKGASDLEKGIKTLNDSYEKFDEAIHSLADGLSDLAVNVSSLKTGVDQIVESYETLDSGITNYTGGVAKIVAAYQQIADGTTNLVDGSSKLFDGSKTLKEGTADLFDGALDLDDGAKELHDGTKEFYDKTDDMDDQIQDKIDTMLDSLTGSDDKTISFVSDKNTNVQSVQFVIKTDAIEKPETETASDDTAEPLTFWEKLVKLFKF